MSVQPGMPEHRGLADRIKTLEAQVARLSRARTMQSTSLDGGTFRVKNGGTIQLVNDSGDVVAELDKDSQTFFDNSGNPLTVLDGNGLDIGSGLVVVDADGLQVGSDVVIDSTGLHVIGGLVTPLWIEDQADFSDDTSLNTTHAIKNSITFDPPSWVQTLFVDISLFVNFTDADAKNVITRIVGESNDNTGIEFGVAGTGTLSTNAAGRRILRSFTSFPVTIEQEARVNSGTNSTNRLDLVGRAVGVRD